MLNTQVQITKEKKLAAGKLVKKNKKPLQASFILVG